MILRPRQRSFVERGVQALNTHGNTLEVAATGFGKCFGKGTEILMYDGTIKKVEDVIAGDVLMGPDSKPRNVLGTTCGLGPLYKVTPVKGEPYVVNEHHILSLKVSGTGSLRGYGNGDIINISVKDYLGKKSHFKHCVKGWRTGVDFDESVQEPLPMDPYILGLWLGDGNSRTPTLTSCDNVIKLEWINYASEIGLDVRVEKVGNAPNYHMTTRSYGVRNPMRNMLSRLNLVLNKHIPHQYKIASREDRLQLLAGIIDTDGFTARNTVFDVVLKHDVLANDLVFLARSLGFAAYLRRCEKTCTNTGAKGIYNRVFISGDTSEVPVRLDRKKCTPRKQKKNHLVTGITVEPCGFGAYYGFEVDQDHLFLLGDFTVTHNSVCLAAVTSNYLDDKNKKGLIVAHRDELTDQNRAKFGRFNPGVSTSVYNATEKNWNGRAVFGMVQSLTTEKGLASIPFLDVLALDETHHAVSSTYIRLIDAVRQKNPNVLLYGVTATAVRGDKKGLRKAGFTNCADQVTIGELVQSGHLVRPRTFVIDLGVTEQLQNVKRTSDDFDPSAVAEILDHKPITDAVIAKWKEMAGDRRTVIFASTVEHSKHVCEAFRAAGVKAEHVDGEISAGERKAIFARVDSGETQVLCNVAVATEGWDCPVVSCVVLLRQSSHIGTYIQMVGRGLRTVDPELHPGVVKTDAIIIDLGVSSLIHGTLESSVHLDGQSGKGEGPRKVCPECDSEIPAGCKTCPLCQYEFPLKDKPGPKEVSDFIMTEVDLLARSPFRWEALWPDGASLIATGFSAWAGVFWWAGVWHAVGSRNGDNRLRHIAQGDKTVCLAAADDFMLDNEDDGSAKKSRSWLGLPPTEKQVQLIRNFGVDVQFYPEAGEFKFQVHKKVYGRSDVYEIAGAECSRYRAACYLSFLFNKAKIKDVICGQDRMAA